MKNLLAQLKHFVSVIIIYTFNCLPIKKNKLFFFSYYGTQFGCNPKYITEYILQHYTKERYDIVWAFNHIESKQHLAGIRKVKTMSIRYFYELCTSKVVITNFRTTDLFIKRKNQYYIQTWHSSLRLKHIEKDAEDSLPKQYIQMAKKDSLKCDLLLSGCDYSTKIFKRAFWFDGEIFEHGTPRNDVLVESTNSNREKILESLQIPSDRKLVLYAPTFRKENNIDIYNLEYSEILKKLSNKYNGKWNFLIKLHPHLSAKSGQYSYGDKIIDVTTYDDIQELLLVTDVLITDYSSLMFDYSITRRPCFLYVPDAVNYTAQDRQLYFNLTELPFKSAYSQAELLDSIEKFNEVEYGINLNQFFDGIGSFEKGNACKKLMSRIEEVCFNEKGGRLYEAV